MPSQLQESNRRKNPPLLFAVVMLTNCRSRSAFQQDVHGAAGPGSVITETQLGELNGLRSPVTLADSYLRIPATT
jgi:hypothetical protein